MDMPNIAFTVLIVFTVVSVIPWIAFCLAIYIELFKAAKNCKPVKRPTGNNS